MTLRSRGLRVIGLWKIPYVPNFDNGMYFDQILTFGKGNQVHMDRSAITLASHNMKAILRSRNYVLFVQCD